MAEKLSRYEILEEIGQGGFAVVYRARDIELDRLVALKELKQLLLQDTDWVRRFRREARAIAKLDHPRIVPIYDVSQTEQRLFIVMRLVNGPSLEELLAQRKPLSWAEALQIITALAEGLDYAHAQGITHRDIKPANILLDPERGPMLTDFGLAKLAGENSMSMTARGSVVGTPHYIAPEIWEGQGTTPQADIYALGCILYEMLTGEKIFKGETPPAVMMAHFKPLSLAEVWPKDVPVGVSQVIKKALARKPTDRYATAGELAAALQVLSADQSPQPAQPAVEAVPDPQPSEEGEADSAEARRQRLADSNVDWSVAEEASWDAGRPFDPMSATDFDSSELELTPGKSSKKWRGFLGHLGPYVIVMGALALINLVTNPKEIWFLWPAMGWGVAIAFHLMGILLSEMKNVSGKWRGFFGHFGSYAIIMSLLTGIYLMSGGGEFWVIWPAMGWGAAVAIHLWATLVTGGSHRAERAARRAERRLTRENRRFQRPKAAPQHGSKELVNPTIQAHLDKARAYREQIGALLKATSGQKARTRLQDLANQVDEWIQAIEALAKRVDSFQRNTLIQQDLAAVPQSIKKLESQLAKETDATTRTELERTLANRKNQLTALQQLQNTMKRAEIKIESTLSALGTIYPQILTSQSTNHVADYGRLSAEMDEEVRTLQDHLEALEEVKLRQM